MLQMFRRSIAALTLAGCLTAAPIFAGGEDWTEDFAGAQTTAASESKDMLLDFTGSDWCGWCIKLVDEVFSKDAFKAYAKENLVLVELDYPKNKPQSDEVKAQNAKLKDAYSIRGYPTIFLTDAKGRPYAQTGYKRGGPEAYIKHLEELKKVRIERDKHMDAAAKVQGIEKAKHLDEALEVLGLELALAHYDATVKEIIKLDAKNEAGLKKKYDDLYTAKLLQDEMQEIMKGVRTDPKAAVEKIDKLVAKEGLPADSKQMALAMKSQIQMFVLKDKDSAKKNLELAIAADPESKVADQLRSALKQHFGGEAESQD